MKKLILLLSIAALLTSCTAQELPEDTIKTESHKYVIEWYTNQTNPSLSVRVRRGGYEVLTENIQQKTYEIDLLDDDLIMIGINHKESAPRPECYLKISRYKGIDFGSGVYKVDELEKLYEKRTPTNSFGYNNIVKNIKQTENL